MSVYPEKYQGSTQYLLAYAEIISAARYRGLTTYQAIAEVAGLPKSGNLMGRGSGRCSARSSRRSSPRDAP